MKVQAAAAIGQGLGKDQAAGQMIRAVTCLT